MYFFKGMIVIDSIGARIKSLRKAHHISQAEFGKRIGVKQNTVATWESGVRVPSEVAIRSICREFKADEDWLRDGAGTFDPDAARSAEITAYMTKLLSGKGNELEMKLIDFMCNTDVEQWDKLLELLQKLPTDPNKKPPDA